MAIYIHSYSAPSAFPYYKQESFVERPGMALLWWCWINTICRGGACLLLSHGLLEAIPWSSFLQKRALTASSFWANPLWPLRERRAPKRAWRLRVLKWKVPSSQQCRIRRGDVCTWELQGYRVLVSASSSAGCNWQWMTPLHGLICRTFWITPPKLPFRRSHWHMSLCFPSRTLFRHLSNPYNTITCCWSGKFDSSVSGNYHKQQK